MSILSEVPVVLQYVRDHTEAYYQVQRDKTAERITTGSTPQQIDKPLEYSASLDRAEKVCLFVCLFVLFVCVCVCVCVFLCLIVTLRLINSTFFSPRLGE